MDYGEPRSMFHLEKFCGADLNKNGMPCLAAAGQSPLTITAYNNITVITKMLTAD
jgi:hypothetical protein